MNIIGFSNQGLLEKDSARTQTLEQLHQRRKQVARLYKRGIKIMQIVEMTGLSYPPVRAAIGVFEAARQAAGSPSDLRCVDAPDAMGECSVNFKKTPCSA